ncbi:MAG: hypothetical protein ACFBSD_12405 [Paracoccaceae bacterium]
MRIPALSLLIATAASVAATAVAAESVTPAQLAQRIATQFDDGAQIDIDAALVLGIDDKGNRRVLSYADGETTGANNPNNAVTGAELTQMMDKICDLVPQNRNDINFTLFEYICYVTKGAQNPNIFWTGETADGERIPVTDLNTILMRQTFSTVQGPQGDRIGFREVWNTLGGYTDPETGEMRARERRLTSPVPEDFELLPPGLSAVEATAQVQQVSQFCPVPHFYEDRLNQFSWEWCEIQSGPNGIARREIYVAYLNGFVGLYGIYDYFCATDQQYMPQQVISPVCN